MTYQNFVVWVTKSSYRQFFIPLITQKQLSHVVLLSLLMMQVQKEHVILSACVCVCVCMSYHVADLHVAVTEDNGVGGVPHWKHDPEWHAHGGRDQSVEGVDLQRLWLDGGK